MDTRPGGYSNVASCLVRYHMWNEDCPPITSVCVVDEARCAVGGAVTDWSECYVAMVAVSRGFKFLKD